MRAGERSRLRRLPCDFSWTRSWIEFLRLRRHIGAPRRRPGATREGITVSQSAENDAGATSRPSAFARELHHFAFANHLHAQLARLIDLRARARTRHNVIRFLADRRSHATARVLDHL